MRQKLYLPACMRSSNEGTSFEAVMIAIVEYDVRLLSGRRCLCG